MQKEVLEKAVAKNYVKNWEWFDYLNSLIKQNVLKYKGKPVTRFVSMRISETMESTECTFYVGSVQYKDNFSKLNMPVASRNLFKEGFNIMIAN